MDLNRLNFAVVFIIVIMATFVCLLLSLMFSQNQKCKNEKESGSYETAQCKAIAPLFWTGIGLSILIVYSWLYNWAVINMRPN